MNEETQKEVELAVRRLFSADAGQYRQYLEAQFSQLKWALGVLLVLVSGVIIYFSGRTYSEVRSFAENQVNERVVDVIFNDKARTKLDDRVTFTIQSSNTQARISELVEKQVRTIVDAEVGKRLNAAFAEQLAVLKTNDLKTSLLPRGIIIPWLARETMPTGWAVCDGGNGTPDLRGKFLMGTDSTKDVGTTGGSTSHTHAVYKNPSSPDGNGFQGEGSRCTIGRTSEVENLPPYFKVIYIIKL